MGELLEAEITKTVNNLQQLRKKHASIDSELFKMLDMLCKSTDSTNPFHMLARQFTSDSSALMNQVRGICKDPRKELWDGCLNRSNSLESLSKQLDAAIRRISK